MNNQQIGQYELIVKDLINKTPTNNEHNLFKNKELTELFENINILKSKIKDNDYNTKIWLNYIQWIQKNINVLSDIIHPEKFYSFMSFHTNDYKLNHMEDYYDVPQTEQVFSFALFMTNYENLSYLIGLVYNYFIIRKYFQGYKMRVYVDFHSVFGSCESFNIFNMFMNIISELDPENDDTLQIVVFFLNPFHRVDDQSLFNSLVKDLDDVHKYYIDLVFNPTDDYIKSPLLNMSGKSESNTNSSTISSTIGMSNLEINTEKIEVTYIKDDTTTKKVSFSMFACHIAVNLRFLVLNENCEFHVRDLDSRMSLTDKNIIAKFKSPRYDYVPFYVFQFYKFYFPFLKWRIDVNPYLAGCFGGDNRKEVMIHRRLHKDKTFKILKKDFFFKYILYLSINACNLQIGFLNDEFILATIFDQLKGRYSENILFMNLGSFTNKHVNEYIYGINKNSNYPCILKLGVPIDILRYPLNGKYLTIDPITDFKIGNVPVKYHHLVKNLIKEQIEIMMGYTTDEHNKLANKIRKNYKDRLDMPIDDELESALFFSMLPRKYKFTEKREIMPEFSSDDYTKVSYSNTLFSSVGNGDKLEKFDDKLRPVNFMIAGYLLSDILEDIIFPKNPEFINSNYYLDANNYDRLFNCLYFHEEKQTFVHRKINKDDIGRMNINRNIIDHIPEQYIEYKKTQDVQMELTKKFDEYIHNSTYYSSLTDYINSVPMKQYILHKNQQIPTNTLIFIKDYMKPIKNNLDETINSVDEYPVKTMEYVMDKENNDVKHIKIKKNKALYQIMLLDDENIHQLTYQDTNKKNKVLIKDIKNNDMSNILNTILRQNNELIIM